MVGEQQRKEGCNVKCCFMPLEALLHAPSTLGHPGPWVNSIPHELLVAASVARCLPCEECFQSWLVGMGAYFGAQSYWFHNRSGRLSRRQ